MTDHRPFGELTKGLSPARKARIADNVDALETALALHELRKHRAVSLEELTAKLSVGQPALEKLERRADVYVSNLRRYVEELGGTLESHGAVSGRRGYDRGSRRGGDQERLGKPASSTRRLPRPPPVTLTTRLHDAPPGPESVPHRAPSPC